MSIFISRPQRRRCWGSIPVEYKRLSYPNRLGYNASGRAVRYPLFRGHMNFRMPSIFSVASFLLDGLLVAGSFHLANWVRFSSGWIPVESPTAYPHYRSVILLVVLVNWTVFKYVGLYRKRRGISGVDELSKVVGAVFISYTLILAATFLSH